MRVPRKNPNRAGESLYEKESREAEAILAKERRCSVCGLGLSLETCVVDEDGCSAHERCYISALAAQHPKPEISS